MGHGAGGRAAQVEKSLAPEDTNRQKLRIIRDEAKRLELMLADVRDFTRPSKPQKGLRDINSVIENTLTLLENDLREQGIQCEKSLDRDLPSVFFDPQQIKQVLINLVKNALEAMSGGGKLVISSFTTKKKGTGLGLAVSHKIMEDHEGEISIQSREGEGTRVIIALPRRPSS